MCPSCLSPACLLCGLLLEAVCPASFLLVCSDVLDFCLPDCFYVLWACVSFLLESCLPVCPALLVFPPVYEPCLSVFPVNITMHFTYLPASLIVLPAVCLVVYPACVSAYRLLHECVLLHVHIVPLPVFYCLFARPPAHLLCECLITTVIFTSTSLTKL